MTLPLFSADFAAVFLREPGEVDARVVLVSDLAERRDVRATTLLGEHASGPFSPVARALTTSARLRATFARVLDASSLRRWRRVRLIGLTGVVPLAMLFELDLERSLLGVRTAGVAAATGLAALGVVLFDLLRSVPRWPRTSAVVFFAAAARFATFLAYSCGKTHPAGLAVYAAEGISVLAGVALMGLAPTRRGLVGECLDALGIDRAEARVPRGPLASPGLLLAATAAAIVLPVLLGLAQAAHVPLLARAVGFAGYAILVPAGIERYLERRGEARRATWWSSYDLRRAPLVALVAFVLTAGLAGGARHGLDALAGIAECLRPGGTGAALVRQIAQEQRIEVARNVTGEPTGLAFVTMTVVLVPLVEERIYRGLVQRLFALRLGESSAIATASLLFGLAHLGVYRVAIYQTCLLGVSFGVAYVEGGIVAAVLAHAVWNLHLLS